MRRRCVEEEFSFCAPVMAGAVHGCLLATFFQPGEGVELRLAFNSRGGGPATPAWEPSAHPAARGRPKIFAGEPHGFKPFGEQGWTRRQRCAAIGEGL